MKNLPLVQKDRESWVIPWPEKHPIYVDVDGTLILWPGGLPGRMPRPTKDGVDPGFGEDPVSNGPVIKRLREMYDNGYEIFVWSRGGRDHAVTVVKFIGIEDIVSQCLPKPLSMIDDDWLWLTEGTQKISISYK